MMAQQGRMFPSHSFSEGSEQNDHALWISTGRAKVFYFRGRHHGL